MPTATHTRHGHARDAEHPSTVLIASEDLVARWSEEVSAPADLIAVSDADPRQALDIISRHHPSVVVLEQLFSSTARGLALVNDLRSHPDLGDVDIRMLPEERASAHNLRAAINGQTLASMSRPLRRSPSRRVRRVRLRSKTEAVLDGMRVELVDLSAAGVQVVSRHILKPNQSVRLEVERGDDVHRAEGTIAWSTAEPGPDQLHFRAGISFRRGQPELLASLLSEVATEGRPAEPFAQ